MNLSIVLAILSGVGHTTAYIDYNRKILKGNTTPNGATWAIWSTLALVSSFSYISATGDIWKAIIPITNILLCIGTFAMALCLGKFQKLDVADWVALCLGIFAVVVWKFSTATYANVIVQVAIIIGFVPTWKSVWRDPSCEQQRPWWIWSATYCVALAVVFLRWRNQWIDLIYPANCILLHASVAVIKMIGGKMKNIESSVVKKFVREVVVNPILHALLGAILLGGICDGMSDGGEDRVIMQMVLAIFIFLEVVFLSTAVKMWIKERRGINFEWFWDWSLMD